MKKIPAASCILIASVLWLTSCNPAQPQNPAKQDASTIENTRSDNSSTNTSSTEKPTDATSQSSTMTGVMMVGGKMVLMMKDGSTRPMEKDTTLPNGVMVTMSGKVLDKNGKTTKTLKESQWVAAGEDKK